LDSIDDPCCRALVDRLQSAGLEVHIHVVFSGVDVPTFHVIVDDVELRDPMFINGGFGCHLSPRIGLSRALTEAAQSRATVIAGAREDLARETYRRDLGYDRIKQMFAPLFDRTRKRRRFDTLTDRSTGNVHSDLDRVLLALESAGLTDVLAVDLTMPSTNVPVVRALVPGAENVHTGELLAGPRLLRALRARSAETA
jgi:ribosomal protein S12 methylthiotransferase accessory factor